MNEKLTIDFVRREFAKEGYLLLSKIYKNSVHKVRFLCPNNHIYHISWHHWRNGRRCGKCNNKKRHDIEFIRRKFESEGYTLLTKEYLNNTQKLRFICPNKHEWKISWKNWLKGNRCRFCGIDKRSRARKLDIKFIESDLRRNTWKQQIRKRSGKQFENDMGILQELKMLIREQARIHSAVTLYRFPPK